MRLVQIPETEEARRRGRIEDWLDLDSIESFQGFNDNSITITTKSGRSLKYGPFSDQDYDELINAILEVRTCNNSH